MNKIIKGSGVLSLAVFLNLSSVTLGYAQTPAPGTCVPSQSVTPTFTYLAGAVTVTDGTNNVSGYEPLKNLPWTASQGSSIYPNCDCTGSGSAPMRYFTTTTTYSVGYTDGTNTFLNLNEYLQAAISFWVAGNVNQYVPAPFTQQPNQYATSSNCGSPAGVMHTGQRGQLTLRIRKPFVGFASISAPLVYQVFATTNTNVTSSVPVAQVSIYGSVTVPQSCSLQAGQIVSVDLGAIPASNFTSGGAGNKPSGFTRVTKQIPVTCTGGVESTASLTMRLEGVPASGYTDTLRTNNSRIGVRITKQDGTTLVPNDTSSTIPFTLSGSATTVTIGAEPIFLGGTAPDTGDFTTLALLRVDFT